MHTNPRRAWLPAAFAIGALPDDPGAPGAPVGGPGGVPTPPAPAGRLMSDADIAALGTREKQQGARQARQELLDALGVKDPEEAKNLIAAAQQAQQAQLTEQQRATQAAETARAAAAQQTAELAAERLSLRKTRALLVAGITPTVDDGKGSQKDNPQLAYAARLLDVDPAADDTAIAAAVTALRADLPALFGAAPVIPGQTRGPAGDPGRPPAGGAPAADPGAIGRSRAQKYAEGLGTPFGAANPASQGAGAATGGR